MPKRSSARPVAAGLATPHAPAAVAKADTAAAAAAAMDLDAFMAGGFDDVMAAVERGGGRGGAAEQLRGGAATPAAAPTAGRAPEPAPPPHKKKLSAEDRHKADLVALKEKDPDFYSYLEAADEELLAFEKEEGEGESSESETSEEDVLEEEESDGDDASALSSDDDSEDGGEVEDAPAPMREVISPGTSDEEDEEEATDGEEGGAQPAAAAPSTPDRPARLPPPPPRPAQAAQILEWCRATKADPSLRSLRQLMQTFRAAAHHGEVGAAEDNGGAGAQAALRLGSGAAFNTLLLFVLREADGLFRRVLDLPAAEPDEVVAAPAKTGGDAAGTPPPPAPRPRVDPRSAPRWRKAEPLIKSYLGNTLHLLGTMTDPAMRAFILRCARPSVPLLVCSDRLARKWVQAALGVFGGPDAGPALQAALFVRAAARALPDPTPDAALKGLYREYVKSSKFMSATHAARLALDAACVVETYGAVGGEAAYRHAFIYVRQLAQVVRGAMGSKAKDAFRAVYCWQTVSCLELWARLVGDLAGKEATASLGALAFPVAHLLQTAAGLVPTPRYLPLRLRCLRALVGLAAAVGVYAPVPPLLCDMLEWKGLHAAPKKRGRGGGGGTTGVASHAADPDAVLLRASKASLASPAFQADLVEQVVELLADALAPWAASPAFPELARPTLVRLRAFAKKCPIDKLRSPVRGLVACLDANAAWVVAARAAAGVPPSDSAGVATFLADARAAGAAPLARYAAVLAQRARDRRTMQTAESFKVGGGRRRAQDEEEDDESEIESEGGSEPNDDRPARPTDKKRGGATAKAAPPSKPAPSGPIDWADDDEDLLQDYNPSDSD